MAQLYFPSYFQPVTSAGVPMPGSKLYFYETGTTNLLTIYEDDGASTAQDNPVIADANGAFPPVYLTVTEFKTVLADPDDVIIETTDKVINGDAGETRSVATGGTGATTGVGALDNLFSKGDNVASATTTDIASATGDYVNITGSTTITAFTSATAGVRRTTRFAGSLQLTHSANLVLPGAANITTAQNDVVEWVSEGSGAWRCASYQFASSILYDIRKITPTSGSFIVGNGSTFEGLAGSKVARLDTEDQTLTGGAGVTVKDLGTKSSGTVTPDPRDRSMQKYVNGGAHTLAPGSTTGNYILEVTNNGSAGAITTSGFDLVDGDDFTTTNGHKFVCVVIVGDSNSYLSVRAMQ